MDQNTKKKEAAKKAFEFILPFLNEDSVIGIGTGSTTNFFIDELIKSKLTFKAAICSSEASKNLLLTSGINILELNEVHGIDFYIDGADEFNSNFELIKGGGGALTREKILAYSSKKFLCIVDDSKNVDLLGRFPLPIEVLEIARSSIAREVMRMGGKPVYRTNFITDNGNQILDVHNLKIPVPYDMENTLNNIPGIVENGIFSKRKADVIIEASDQDIKIINIETL
ncbi:MAG: ribose-5-phosphate isomerase RpiA [SAR86 cluster bacterium]|jgi:ribose 5-phosphate isomerase A|nr:ribose-5-phosphate isomerase RpiA [SAR86 cluster bacterium]|tara:strand:+ start:21495 stop:22175 length:681 start_codon:yes stop_codon:yes gene_type:complete